MSGPFDAAIELLRYYTPPTFPTCPECRRQYEAAIRVLEAAGKMDGPGSRLFWELCKKQGNLEWSKLEDFFAALPMLTRDNE